MSAVYFYIHTLEAGGAEKQCALMAAELKRRYGYGSVVILNSAVGAKPEFVKYLTDANVGLIVLPSSPILRWACLYRLFHSNKDAILFNYLTYPDFIGALIAHLAGLKRIFGGIETDRMFGYKFWLEKFSHKFLSYKTTCNSHKALEFFASHGFDSERMPVTPSAIEMTPDENLPVRKVESPVRIITVGRFVPAKDYPTWLDVVAHLVDRGLPIRATIIGYGELEDSIRAQITQKHLDGVVTILPGQDIDVRKELQAHDIYLSTSIREGTSNTILEAMDSALPIVATRVGDNSQMIENGVSGFLCDPADAIGLASAVENLVADARLRLRFGGRSREILGVKYSLGQIASTYDALIREVPV